MAGTERALTDLDTMLLLRRVLLFEGLDPEDLQRIVTTCIERTYTDGEAIMREGGPWRRTRGHRDRRGAGRSRGA